MDRKAIAQRLRELAYDDKKRSKAARLRDVINDVEEALAAGVPQATVVEELANHGLELTHKSFKNALYRIRQKRSKTIAVKSASPTGQPTKPKTLPAVDEAEAEVESSGGGSHNPADLDKIMGSKPDLAALAKLAKRKKS